jgi:hypothetical protein
MATTVRAGVHLMKAGDVLEPRPFDAPTRLVQHLR